MDKQDNLFLLGNSVSDAPEQMSAWIEEMIRRLPERNFTATAAEYVLWQPSRRIQVHCHEELFHLEFFRGRGRFLLDGREYPMRRTTLLLIPPSREHAFASASGANLQNRTVKFQIQPRDLLARLPVVYLCDWSGPLANHMQDGLQWVFEEWQLRGLGWEELVGNTLRNLTAAMLRAGLECLQVTGQPVLEAACRYMALHYAQPIRIKDVARQCGLRPDSLSRLFRTHLDQTPQMYLQTIRLNQAKALLRSGYTVTEVAEQSGFSSVHYFSRLFRHVFSLPPSRWVYHNRDETSTAHA